MGFVSHAVDAISSEANHIGDVLAPYAVPIAIAAAIYLSAGSATPALSGVAASAAADESALAATIAANSAAAAGGEAVFGAAAPEVLGGEAVFGTGAPDAFLASGAGLAPLAGAGVGAEMGALSPLTPQTIAEGANTVAPVTAGTAADAAAAGSIAEGVPELTPLTPQTIAPDANVVTPVTAAPEVPLSPLAPQTIAPDANTVAQVTAPPVTAPTSSILDSLNAGKTALNVGNTIKSALGGKNLGSTLGTLASLYSGSDAAAATARAGDALQKSITTAQGQLLTSKTEALDALSKGLIDQKTAIREGLVDANGALTTSMQQALMSISGGATTARGDLTAALSPFSDAGKTALARLTAGTAPGGEFAGTFTMADAQNSPAMQFAQQQGMDVIQNSAAARGGLLGTNSLKNLQQFGQANAAQYENQAFQQWLANRNANQAGLQTLANNGQSAAGAIGTGLANIDTNAANASSAAIQAAGGKIAGNNMTAAGNTANAIGSNGTNIANINTGYGKSMADLLTSGGSAAAKAILGETSARNTGLNNGIAAGTSLLDLYNKLPTSTPQVPLPSVPGLLDQPGLASTPTPLADLPPADFAMPNSPYTGDSMDLSYLYA